METAFDEYPFSVGSGSALYGYVNAKFIAGGLKGYRAQAAKVNPMLL